LFTFDFGYSKGSLPESQVNSITIRLVVWSIAEKSRQAVLRIFLKVLPLEPTLAQRRLVPRPVTFLQRTQAIF